MPWLNKNAVNRIASEPSFSNLCWIPLHSIWMLDRFVGPAFSGYHFQADAHDTWENKNVLLIPKLRLFKSLISRHSTPMKNRVITGFYAVSTPIYAVTCFFCMYFYFLDSEWQASWTANNLFEKACCHRFGQTTLIDLNYPWHPLTTWWTWRNGPKSLANVMADPK